MKRTITTLSVLALSTGMAYAQAQPQTVAPQQPAPRTTAPAPRTTPQAPAAPVSTTVSSAPTAIEAQRVAEAKVKAREEACKQKGEVYKWKAPHKVGDPDGKGGFWVTNYNGGCKVMSMKEALSSGLITVNRRPN